MPLLSVTGDPLLTPAQTLGFGINARGRVEVGAFELRLFDRYPAAFATFRKACHSGRIRPGTLWLWRESQPHLAFLVVRESPVGATRLRFVESIAMTLARDYRLHGLESLALAPLARPEEWDTLRPALTYWLAACPLPVTVYTAYEPDQRGEG